MNTPLLSKRDLIIRRSQESFDDRPGVNHEPCEACGDPLGWAREDEGFLNVIVQFMDGEGDEQGWYTVIHRCHPGCFGNYATQLFDNHEKGKV